MFFGKNERRKTSFVTVMAIGALATVGAVGIFRKGKEAVGCAFEKIKGVIKRDNDCQT